MGGEMEEKRLEHVHTLLEGGKYMIPVTMKKRKYPYCPDQSL